MDHHHHVDQRDHPMSVYRTRRLEHTQAAVMSAGAALTLTIAGVLLPGPTWTALYIAHGIVMAAYAALRATDAAKAHKIFVALNDWRRHHDNLKTQNQEDNQ